MPAEGPGPDPREVDPVCGEWYPPAVGEALNANLIDGDSVDHSQPVQPGDLALLENALTQDLDDLERFERYVRAAWSTEPNRVRRLLNRLRRDNSGRAGPLHGLVLLGLLTDDAAETDRAALLLYRELPGSADATDALLGEALAKELRARAQRSRVYDARTRPHIAGLHKGQTSSLALAVLRDIIDEDDTYTPAQRLFFRWCLNAGDAETARAMYQQLESWADHPRRAPELGLLAGKVMEASGDVETALAMYLRSVVDAPRNPEARAHVTRIVRTAPHLRAYVENLGGAMRAIASDARALDQLLDELRGRPAPVAEGPVASSAQLRRAAQEAERAGNRETSADLYRQWAEKEASYEAYMLAGQAWERLGLARRSQHLYSHALNTRPDDSAARAALARIEAPPGSAVSSPTPAVATEALTWREVHAGIMQKIGDEPAGEDWYQAALFAFIHGEPYLGTWARAHAAARGCSSQQLAKLDAQAAAYAKGIWPRLRDVTALAGFRDRAGLREALLLLCGRPLKDFHRVRLGLALATVPKAWLEGIAEADSLAAVQLVQVRSLAAVAAAGSADSIPVGTDRRLGGLVLLAIGRTDEAAEAFGEDYSALGALTLAIEGRLDEARERLPTVQEVVERVIQSMVIPDPRRNTDSMDPSAARRAEEAYELFTEALDEAEPGQRTAKLERAGELYRSIASPGSSSGALAMLNAVVVRMHLGRFTQASQLLPPVVSKLPRDPSVRWAELICAVQLRDTVAVLASCTRMLVLDPHHRGVRTQCVVELMRSGHAEAAWRVLRPTLSPTLDEPKLATALRAALEVGDPAVFNEAIAALDPTVRLQGLYEQKPDQLPPDPAQEHGPAVLQQVLQSLVDADGAEEARAWLRAYVLLHPSDGAARILLDAWEEDSDALPVVSEPAEQPERAPVDLSPDDVTEEIAPPPSGAELGEPEPPPVPERLGRVALEGLCDRLARDESPGVALDHLLDHRAAHGSSLHSRLLEYRYRFMLGEREDTIDALRQLAERTQGGGQKWIYKELAACLLEGDRPAEALDILALQVVPEAQWNEDVRALYQRAKDATRDRARGPAVHEHWVGWTGEPVQIPPRLPYRALVDLLSGPLAQGRYGDVAAGLEEYRKNSPRYYPVRRLLAETYLKLKERDRAIEELRGFILNIASSGRPEDLERPVISLALDLPRLGLADEGASVFADLPDLPVECEQVAQVLLDLARRDSTGSVWGLLAAAMDRRKLRKQLTPVLREGLQRFPHQEQLVEIAKRREPRLVRRSEVSEDEVRGIWRRYERVQQYEEGLNRIRSFRQKEPDRVDLARIELTALDTLGEREDGLAVLGWIAEQTMERNDRIELMTRLIEAGKEPPAMKISRTLLEADPFDPQVYERLQDLGMSSWLLVETTDRELLWALSRYLSGRRAASARRDIRARLERVSVEPIGRDLALSILEVLVQRDEDEGAWPALVRELSVVAAVAAPQNEPSVELPSAGGGEPLRREPVDDPLQVKALEEMEGRLFSIREAFRSYSSSRRHASKVPHWQAFMLQACIGTCDALGVHAHGDFGERDAAELAATAAGAWSGVSSDQRPQRALELVFLMEIARRECGPRTRRGSYRGPRRSARLPESLVEPLQRVVIAASLDSIAELMDLAACSYLREVLGILQRCLPRKWLSKRVVDRSLAAANSLYRVLRSSELRDRELHALQVSDQLVALRTLSRNAKLPYEVRQSLRGLVQRFNAILDPLTSALERRARLEVEVRRELVEEQGRSGFGVTLCIKNLGDAPAQDVEVRASAVDCPDLRIHGTRKVERKLNPGQMEWQLTLVGGGKRTKVIELEIQVRYIATDDGLQADADIQAVVVPPWSDVRRRIGRNPYKAGPMVAPGEATYVDRKHHLETIRGLLDAGNAVMVYGFRRVGKSSILGGLAREPGERRLAAQVDLQGLRGKDTREGELLLAMAESIRRAAYTQGADVPLDPPERWKTDWTLCLNAFLGRLRAMIPGWTVLVLLDEFEIILEKIGSTHIEVSILNLFRSLMQPGTGLQFVIAGTNRLLEMGRDYREMLFGQFRSHRVDLLDEEEAGWLVHQPLHGELGWDRRAVAYLIEQTACHPMLLQELCHHVVTSLDAEPRAWATRTDVHRAIHQRFDSQEQQNAYEPMFDRAGLTTEQQLVMTVIAEKTGMKRSFRSPAGIASRLAEAGVDLEALQVEAIAETLVAMKLLQSAARADGVIGFALTIPLLAAWLRRHQSVEKLRAALRQTFDYDDDEDYDRDEDEFGDDDEPMDGDMELDSDLSIHGPHLVQDELSDLPRPIPVVPVVEPAPGPAVERVAEPAIAAPEPSPEPPQAAPRRVIPYREGHAVHLEGEFFGRADHLHDLELSFAPGGGRGHMQYVGPVRVGKSSLLHRIGEDLRKLDPTGVVVEMSGQFFHGASFGAFISELIALVAEAAGVSVPACEGLPQKALEKLLMSLSAQGRWTYLLLDEFQRFVLDGKLDNNDFSTLRGYADMRSIKMTYIIVTLAPLKTFSTEATVSEFANKFSRNIQLGPLDHDSAVAAVEQPLAGMPDALPVGAGEAVYRLCGGHPWLTACLAAAWLRARWRDDQVPDTSGTAFTDWALQALNEPLETLSKKTGRVWTLGGPVALSVEDRAKAKDIVERSLQLALPPGDPEPAVQALLNTGLVVKRGERLHPVGKLALAHLKEHFGLRQRRGVSALPDERDQLQKQLESLEPRLRDHLATQLEEKYGSPLLDALDEMSSVEKRELSRESVKGDPSRLTFSQLLEIAVSQDAVKAFFKRASRSAGRMRSAAFHTKQARNDDAHNRFPTANDVDEALAFLALLDEFVDKASE